MQGLNNQNRAFGELCYKFIRNPKGGIGHHSAFYKSFLFMSVSRGFGVTGLGNVGLATKP